MSEEQTGAITKEKYRPEIDGLRGFAVVAVIINHFNKDILPGGYLGVDIFFVISGYVITSSLYGRPNKNFIDFISGFYERRIKRILPALMLNVLIVSLLISLFNPTATRDLRTGALSILGISNIYLAINSTDYFGPSASLNAFTQTWSLGVEEQFYMIYPLAIKFTGFTQGKKVKDFAICLGSLGLLSLALFLFNKAGYGAYFLLNFRFWEITAGCLTFLLYKRVGKSRLRKLPIPALAVSFIILIMFLPVEKSREATLAVVALVAILLLTISNTAGIYRLLTGNLPSYIGLTSYSLYLWHWSIIVLSRFTLGIHWWTIPFQLILILVISHLSYKFIELPIRRSKQKTSIVCIGGIGSAISFSSALLLGFTPHHARLYQGKDDFSLTNAQPSSAEFRLTPNVNNGRNFFFIGDCYAGTAWWYSKDKLLRMGYNIFVNPRNAGLTPATGLTESDLHLSMARIQLRNYKERIKPGDFIGFAVNSQDKLLSQTKEALKIVIEEAMRKKAKVIIFGQYPSYPSVDYVLCTPKWYRPDFSINRSCNGRGSSRSTSCIEINE